MELYSKLGSLVYHLIEEKTESQKNEVTCITSNFLVESQRPLI